MMMPRVLIVEDNPVNLELTRQILEDDYEVIVAVDGAEAIDAARREKPDIILMDLSLPKIDGWQATATLRSEGSTASIPIIAVTAHAIKGDREKVLESGFDDYISKPVDEDLLLKAMKIALSQNESVGGR